MPRALIASMIFWCFFSSQATDSRAQNPPKQDSTYRAGLACFDQLDFSCAIELLGAAAQSGATDKNRLVDIYRKLAESHLALGQRKEAVLDFIALLEIQPAYDITSAGVSPKIIDALDQARQRIEKDKPIPVEPPSKPAGIEFGRALDLATEPELKAEALYNLGTTRLAGGQADKAAEDLMASLELDPDYALAIEAKDRFLNTGKV